MLSSRLELDIIFSTPLYIFLAFQICDSLCIVGHISLMVQDVGQVGPTPVAQLNSEQLQNRFVTLTDEAGLSYCFDIKCFLASDPDGLCLVSQQYIFVFFFQILLTYFFLFFCLLRSLRVCLSSTAG